MTAKELNKLKVADLRKMAEEKNLPGWEDKDKKALVADLADKEPPASTNEDAQGDESGKEKAKDTSADDVPKPPDANVQGLKEEHVPAGSKAERMKATLAAQPKVTVLIPLGSGEKKGVTESVILNGYRLNIKKGVYVPVPQQVAEVIRASNDQTVEAENHALRLSGEGPKALQ